LEFGAISQIVVADNCRRIGSHGEDCAGISTTNLTIADIIKGECLLSDSSIDHLLKFVFFVELFAGIVNGCQLYAMHGWDVWSGYGA
jgi:hypothetical protein